MQKKLIALAVAGLASTGAFAQSNVTVYGVADATYDVVKVSSSTTATNDVGNINRVSTNSSLIGFKGAEALGNGLTAVFQFESGVSFDNAGTLSTGRDSFVGLASGFGTVVAGNLTGPTRALGVAMDVNAGATGIGTNQALLGKLGNNLLNSTSTADGSYTPGTGCTTRSSTCASIFDTRWKNAIAYVSPTLYGLNLTAAYVANENKGNKLSASGGQQASTQGYDVGLKYANGPILAGVTYNAVSVNNGVATPGYLGVADTSVSDLRAGASYDFGIASIRSLYDQAKAKNYLPAGDVKQSVWGLGGTFNVTPAGKLIGQFYKANQMKVAGASQANTGAKLYELGYEYSLSKRTMLKAVYSTIHNDDAAKYDFGVNATGVAALGSTVSGVSLGLRHTF